MGVTLVVVGQRPLMREGLGRCLRARGCQVIGESGGGVDALRLALKLHPRVVVVDAAPGDKRPFELARHLIAADRRQRVLMVASTDDPVSGELDRHLLEQTWDSGAHGVVAAGATADQLARAVNDVSCGISHLPPRHEADTPNIGDDHTSSLTRRERQVLGQIAHGANTLEAAQHLLLSPATVKHHLSSAHRKLGARSRVEAVMLAVTRGYIDVDPAELRARRGVTRSAGPRG
jgi:DNA-binding NarL/FixJ family response regulator